MPSYDPTAPLISLHVPKTGGTSLRQVLESWFPDGRLLLHYRDGATPPARHVPRGPVCIHGHFNGARGIGAWHYYSDIAQHVTFLRDPFDRFLSQWFYLNQRKQGGGYEPDLADDPGFELWLRRRGEEQAEGRNGYSFLWQMPVPPGGADWDAVLAEKFVFVGIMERYPRSLAALAALLGKPSLPPPHVNATGRDRDLGQWRGLYEKLFADEYELDEKARARNAAWLSSAP